MDADTGTEAMRPQLPKGSPPAAASPASSMVAASKLETVKVDATKLEAATEAERNPIFDALVTPNEDVAGLVAYSIYKQNKRAWLDDFIKATGRAPTEAESRAYIIGESTERRLNTYRHLAAATLSGQGPRAPTLGGATTKAAPIAGALWALAIVIVAGMVLALAVHAGYFAPAK